MTISSQSKEALNSDRNQAQTVFSCQLTLSNSCVEKVAQYTNGHIEVIEG